jgi:hypothetical protein
MLLVVEGIQHLGEADHSGGIPVEDHTVHVHGADILAVHPVEGHSLQEVPDEADSQQVAAVQAGSTLDNIRDNCHAVDILGVEAGRGSQLRVAVHGMVILNPHVEGVALDVAATLVVAHVDEAAVQEGVVTEPALLILAFGEKEHWLVLAGVKKLMKYAVEMPLE